MKNTLLGTVALSVLLATSCTKQKTVEVTDNWTIGGTPHIVKDTMSFDRGAQAYMAKDVDGNTIYFYFHSLPTQNGVYRVVHNSNPLFNQIYISTQSIGKSAYQSIGNDSLDAVVTVSGDKVTIAVPNIWIGNVNMVINDTTWHPTDSMVLSATTSFKLSDVIPPFTTGGAGFFKTGTALGHNGTTVSKHEFLNGSGTADSVMLSIDDGAANIVNLWFKKYPTGSGQYKVVSGGLHNDNDVRILSSMNNGENYLSTGDGAAVTVTAFSDGIGISVPHTWTANAANSADSLAFTTVIMQR